MSDAHRDGVADEPVDPRYDPRYQRGYVPGRDAVPPETRDGAAPSVVRRPDPPRRDPDVIRAMPEPAGPSAEKARAEPIEAGPEELDEFDPDAERRARVWTTVLAVASGIGVVVGAIAVAALTTRAPLRFETAANSGTAASHFALELLGGPVLIAGLLGAAVALALFVTARRREPLPDDDEPEPPSR